MPDLKDPKFGLNQTTPLETKEEIKPVEQIVKKDETVVVPKNLFEAMQKRLERLEETANKGRLNNYDNVHKNEQTPIIKLRTIDGKVIIKWSDLVANKVEINPITKKVEEDQRLIVYYEDGTEQELDLVLFNRRYNYIQTTLKEEKKRPDGTRILLLETAEGKEYEVDVKYVN
jgi:hypothetical protein